MDEYTAKPGRRGENPFDVDAIMRELQARVQGADDAGAGLTPFSCDFTGAEGVEVFEVSPEIHGSTKPVVGPFVTRGKQMVARAAAPMVAGLGEQIALSIAELRRSIDDLTEEQARLREAVGELRRRMDQRDTVASADDS